MNSARLAAIPLTAAALLLSPSPPCDAQEDRSKEPVTERVTDLSGIRSAPPDLESTGGPQDVRPFGPSTAWYLRPPGAERREPGPGIDAILEIARSTLPPELAETADLALLGDGASVRVRTTADGHRRVEALLDAFRTAWGSPYEIDVRVVTLPEDAAGDALLAEAERSPGGRLAPEVASRLVAADPHGGGRGAIAMVLPGRWALVESVREVPAVTDFNVEIAEDSSISDPIVRGVEEGVRAAVRACPLADGRTAVSVAAAAGDIVALRRLEMRTTDLGSVELPDVAGAIAATEVVLASGEGAAVVLSAPTTAGSSSRYVVLVRLVSAPPRTDTGDLAILPVGTLAVGRAGPFLGGKAEDEPDHETPFDGGVRLRWDEEPARLSVDDVVQQIHEGTGDAFEKVGSFLTATADWPGGGAVVLQAPRDVRARAAQIVERIERSAVASAWTSVRLVETPLGTTKAEEALRTGRTVAVLAGPVAPGGLAAFASYRSTCYVGDYDVEVAQKSRIADPHPRVATGGVLANLRLGRSAKGSWRVDLSLNASSAGAVEAAPVHATEVGTVERVAIRRARFAGSVVVAPGAPRAVDLGESPWRAPGTARLWAVVRVE